MEMNHDELKKATDLMVSKFQQAKMPLVSEDEVAEGDDNGLDVLGGAWDMSPMLAKLSTIKPLRPLGESIEESEQADDAEEASKEVAKARAKAEKVKESEVTEKDDDMQARLKAGFEKWEKDPKAKLSPGDYFNAYSFARHVKKDKALADKVHQSAKGHYDMKESVDDFLAYFEGV